jgi:hypothetical protein
MAVVGRTLDDENTHVVTRLARRCRCPQGIVTYMINLIKLIVIIKSIASMEADGRIVPPGGVVVPR